MANLHQSFVKAPLATRVCCCCTGAWRGFADKVPKPWSAPWKLGLMSSTLTGWGSCYCILLPACLLQITLDNLSFFMLTSLEIYLSRSKPKAKEELKVQVAPLFLFSLPQCACAQTQPCRAGAGRGPAALTLGNLTAELPFLCLTSDL